MTPERIMAICELLTVLGGVAVALIKGGGLLAEVKANGTGLDELRKEHSDGFRELRSELASHAESTDRSLRELRGYILGAPAKPFGRVR